MKSKLIVLALCGILVSSIAGWAQSSTTQSNAMLPPDMHHGHRDPARELARLTRDLNLTAAQQTQIKPILDEREAQMQTLHDDTSLSREAIMAKAKNVMDQSDSAIAAVLDTTQKAEFQKQLEARQARMAHRHGNSASPDSAPPPDGEGPPPDGPGI